MFGELHSNNSDLEHCYCLMAHVVRCIWACFIGTCYYNFLFFFLNSVLQKWFCFACARCYVLPNIDNHQNDIKYILYRCVHCENISLFFFNDIFSYLHLIKTCSYYESFSVFIIFVASSYFSQDILWYWNHQWQCKFNSYLLHFTESVADANKNSFLK